MIISCKGETFDVFDSKFSIYIVYPDGKRKLFYIVNILEHLKEYIKIGYCSSMKVLRKNSKDFLRIKLPKKEKDLRNFFDYHGTKASYDLDIMECNPKYVFYGELLDMNNEECNSYLCGLMSSNCNVNLEGENRRQCLRFRFPEKREKTDGKCSHSDWFDFYQNISKCVTYTSGKGLGIIYSIPNLFYFIRHIGVIQNDKMSDIIKLFFQKIDKSDDYDVEVVEK